MLSRVPDTDTMQYQCQILLVALLVLGARGAPQQYQAQGAPQQYQAQGAQYRIGAQPAAAPQQQYRYVSAQPVQYRQLTQEEFLAAYAQQNSPPVKEDQPEQVRYVTLQSTQGNVQPILGSVDRQVSSRQ